MKQYDGAASTLEPTASSPPAPSATVGAALPHTPGDAPAPGPLRGIERYEIVSEHGRGGLGRVSRARDRELERDVAIKELLCRTPVSEVRFFREALITARLEHPGIVPVHEAGRWPDGTPFYAMKLVAGRPLRDLIAERSTIDARLGLLPHVIAVADALAYAHDRQIIHRDLKPGNVIVGDFGETVVIDWGLAKDLKAHDDLPGTGASERARADDLTRTGSVLGTPAYMAPEQARGEPVDQRADVFAIGAMLWELCSLDKVPPEAQRVRHRVLTRAGIDRDLIAILDKALAHDPALRYANAGALAADLKAFATGARIGARTYTLPALLAHWTRRHRALALTSLVFSLAAVVGVSLYFRNVAVARDLAQQARDKAELAQATLLLDKDPTAAKELLGSTVQPSAQQAFLLSRANRLAAVRKIPIPRVIYGSAADDARTELAIDDIDGALVIANLDTGFVHTIDHHLPGALIATRQGWLYAKRPPKQHTIIVDTAHPDDPLPAGDLLAGAGSKLLVADTHIYAFDKNAIYTLTPTGPVVLRDHVRAAGAGSDTLLICTADDDLLVFRGGVERDRKRCAKNTSTTPLVVAGHHYAALEDPDTLLLVRDDVAIELPTHIVGEYQLALSADGALALADDAGQGWFVRPGGRALEPAPLHATSPTNAVATGSYVAWSYGDGTVIALDVRTNQRWELTGHDSPVANLTIDAQRHRVISGAGHEVRVWQLAPEPWRKIADLPSKIFNLAPSPDGTMAVLDGADGQTRIWRFADNQITATSAGHRGGALGVAWWNGLACTGGFDGQVLCADKTGPTRQLLTAPDAARWLIASADHHALFIASGGKIIEFEQNSRVLYTHDADAYRMALSPDQQLLASGAWDGSLIVYNYPRHAILATVHAHDGLVTAVAWRDHMLWTAGNDATIKQWRMVGDTLQLEQTISDTGTARLFHLLPHGWAANVGEHLVRIENGDLHLRLDPAKRINHIDVSRDGRYVSIASTTEIFIVDLEHRAFANVGSPMLVNSYEGFIQDNQLVISTERGLFALRPSQLTYTPF